MDDFFDIPTLIVIGVAIVVLFRLRQVLGTRVGHERPPTDATRAESAAERRADETVVTLRPRPAEPRDDEARTRKFEAEVEQFSHGDAEIAAGLKSIGDADPAFSPKAFIEGAKQAYEMILAAFAAGDRKTLRNLLENDVYDSFERSMKEREGRGETVEFTFVGLPRIDISHAAFDRRNALVTVQFHAEVVSATHARDGSLIEGDTSGVKQIADEWTFSRNPKSRDPNWKLVATNQLD